MESFASDRGVGERGKSQLRQHLWGQGGQMATGARRTASSPYDENDRCKDCGAHFAEPHSPGCRYGDDDDSDDDGQRTGGARPKARIGVRKGAPFADYEDFDDCSGEIKHRTEDKKARRAKYTGDGDVEDKSGPFAGPNDSFPVGTEKDLDDAKSVCNMPSVRDKHPGTCEKVDKMGSVKTSWMGWGPAQKSLGKPKVAGWDWDQHLLAYTADEPRTFTCDCGESHEVPGYHNCRCGKIWNGYVIGSGGDTRAASAEKFLVREVPVRPGVLVANRQARSLDDEPLPFPSDHVPDTPEIGATPEDWHSRSPKGQYTPGGAPKRKKPRKRPVQQ